MKTNFKINIKRAIALTLTLTTVMVIQPPVTVSAAKTLKQLQAERADLAKQSASAKTELEAIKNKKVTVQEELDAIDKVLSAAQAELDTAQRDLNDVTARLDESKVLLEQAIIDRDKQMDVFGKRIKYMQENGSVGYLEIVLEAKNIADVLARMQYIQDIIAYDNKILTVLEANQKLIEQKTKDIEEEQAESEKLLAEQKVKTTAAENALKEKKRVMAAYQQDEAKYNQLVENLAKADKDATALINKALAEAAASGSASGFVYTGGKLNWPVPARAASPSSLSSGYVSRNRPIGRGTEFHTGYDIPAPYGSNIVAAEAGTVIYSGWMNGYGNTIMINHGGGLVTLYGHNSSLVVSKGSSVTRGQSIARCGSTGNSTGNHCHFEVRANGSTVNPSSYLGVPNINR